MKTLLSLVLLATLLTSCATKKITVGENEVSKKGVFALSAKFLKQKKKLFAGEFAFHNLNSEKSYIIFLRDVQCKWGDQRGIARNDRPFNIGEKTINIHPGGTKMVKLRCDVPSKGKGEMQVAVKKIYDNKNHDGKSASKVFAKDIVWKYTTK